MSLVSMDTTLPIDAVTSFRWPGLDGVAINCVFGNSRELRTWSGAPANVASGLERLGVIVQAIQPQIGRMAKARIALIDMMAGHGRPLTGEQVLRSLATRRRLAAHVDATARQLRVQHVLHTGTLDLLPSIDMSDSTRHYLYCDRTCALSRQHHPHASLYPDRAR